MQSHSEILRVMTSNVKFEVGTIHICGMTRKIKEVLNIVIVANNMREKCKRKHRFQI